MWDTSKQDQLDVLQRRAQENVLTDAEQHRLDALLYELEQQEWQTLASARASLRDEQIRNQRIISDTNQQTAALSALALRQADLLHRAQMQLTTMRHEYGMNK